MKDLQVYTYTIPANGSIQIPAANDNFIVTAATGPVSVRGDTFGTLPALVAGQGLKMIPFNRLELVDRSGAPNTVTILLSPAEFVNQTFSGSVTIVGGTLTDAQLRASAVDVRQRPERATGNWSSLATMAVNTPLTVFAPGANVNGAIILQAEAQDSVASIAPQAFVAKISAPATVFDGDVIAQSLPFAVATSNTLHGTQLQNPVRLDPGLGLYFISQGAGSAGGSRSCRFILL